MFRISLLAVFVLQVLAINGHNYDNGDAENDAEVDSICSQFALGEVVVTGTRTPKFLKDTPIQMRVITSHDIERTDATNIQDLLQQEMPGVEFSYAMNQQTHLNFSGFGGQSLLFLIDGERLAGETMDDVDFTRLTMDNVERIEIVRGAASALYGSSASGGVINIITKKAKKPCSFSLNAHGGKHNEQRYNASFGLKGQTWSNMLTANYNSIDNYDVKNGANPVTRVISTIYGNKVYNIKEHFSWNAARQIELSAHAGYFFREVSRTVDLPERYRDFSGGLRLKWNVSDNDALQVDYSFDQYDKSDYQRLAHLDIRDYSNVQNVWRMLYSHTTNKGSIFTIGADYMHDWLFNTNIAGNERNQDCFDVFAQYDHMFNDRWELVGAIRYDYFSDGGDSRVTPKINLCHKPTGNLALRLGYGMGFRTPSLKEKYYNFDMSGIWIVEGNPNLKSEVSHNFNASAEYTKGHYNIILSAYYNIVKNKLATSAPYFKSVDDKLPYLPYANLDNYRVYGMEIGVQSKWNCGLSSRITYAYSKENLPENKQGETVNNQYIPAREHVLNIRIDYEKRFTRSYGIGVGLSGRVLSNVKNVEYKNYYNIQEGTLTVSYPAYSIWKLALVQNIGKAVKVNIALDNILNYKPEYYYLNSPLTDGINFQAGITVSL